MKTAETGGKTDRDVYVRAASGDIDAQRLLQLIGALAEFEHLAGPDEAARARFVADGFARTPPRFEALLAGIGREEPTGYAIHFETYSTFLCRPTLYLEDLFVVPDRRGCGIGLALMQHLAGIALQRGCGRLEWACLDWNRKAQQFYADIGAKHRADWLFYRMDSATFEEFARL